MGNALDEIDSRLGRLEALLAARGGGLLRRAGRAISGMWDEALHPRGKDGRFIEKNGSVSGSFQPVDGNGRPSGSKINVSRARTIGFSSGDGASADDPWVLAEFSGPNGQPVRGIARASEISQAADAKARLDAEDLVSDVPEGDALDAESPDAERVAQQRKFAEDFLAEKGLAIGDPIRAVNVMAPERFDGNVIKDIFAHKDGYAFLVGNPDDPDDRSNLAPNQIVPMDRDRAQRLQELQRRPGGTTPEEKQRQAAEEFLAVNGLAIGDPIQAVNVMVPQRFDGNVLKDIFAHKDGYAFLVGDPNDPNDRSNLGRDQIQPVPGNQTSVGGDIDTEALERSKADVADFLGESDAPEPETSAPDLSTAESVREHVNTLAENLSDSDPQARAETLEEIFSGTFRSPLDTNREHNELGPAADQWTDERSALHEQMWDDLISKVDGAGIPKGRDALVLGGLPGAGKSTTLQPGNAASKFGVTAWDPAEGDPPQGSTHVSVNPDSIKEMLIDSGALPSNINEKLKPMEQATFIHEESSFLSKLFLKRLSDEGYNVVLDNTMETPTGMLKRMGPLAGSGYRFRGLFVDIPVEESKLSARRRYNRAFATPRGGRYVPSAVQADRKSSRGRLSANRDAFDELAGIDEDGNVSGNGWFDEFIVVDNTGVSEGNARGDIVLEGIGDGSPAGVFASAPGVVVAAVQRGNKVLLLDDELSRQIRLRRITPEDALNILKADGVLVYEHAPLGDGATWGDAEDRGASGSDIQHALKVVGRGDLADEFSGEIQRLRDAGLTMESLFPATMPSVPEEEPDEEPEDDPSSE